MSPPSRKPTMRDVSRLAGVSTMTVSRVLADPAMVAQDTRLRVMQAVEQLGYVPDRVAGSLSSRRTNFVGLILPTLTNSNFGDTAQGLAETLGPRGYQLLIGYTLYRVAEEEQLVRAMLARRPDAIVIAGNIHSASTQRMLLNAGIPVVEIWEHPEAPLDRAVGFSNFEAGRAAGRHLLDLGHQRIGAIGSLVKDGFCDYRGEARLQGFAAALRDVGMSDDLVIRNERAPVSFDHGARTTALLLEQAPDVDAIFAVSDASAFGAVMECKRRGIAVPGRISILGFGDFEVGRQCSPAISTIRVDANAIGERTGTMLLDLIEGERTSREPHVIDVGFALLARETTMRRST